MAAKVKCRECENIIKAAYCYCPWCNAYQYPSKHDRKVVAA